MMVLSSINFSREKKKSEGGRKGGGFQVLHVTIHLDK